MSADLEQALGTFFTESRDLLQSMEDGLLRLEREPADGEAVNAVFRAAHTIKGSAGLFGLEGIVRFTHVLENTLERVRGGLLGITPELIALLLSCGDHVGRLVEHMATHGRESDDERVLAAGAALAEQLKSLAGAAPAQETAAPVDDKDQAADCGTCVLSDNWHLSLRFGRDALRHGLDPLSFLRYLATMGDIHCINTLYEGIPSGDGMDPESCYLGFEIEFHSAANKCSIEDVFEFVRDDCRIRILPPNARIEEYAALIRELPEEERFLGDTLVASGALTPKELEEALSLQHSITADQGPGQRLGEILVAEQLVQQPLVEVALEKQQQVRDAKAKERGSIRVQADKLDRLINLVGELVIAGASANLLAQQAGLGALLEATSAMGRLVEEIRDGALRLRMVEIGETFHRFHRVVRDVGKELGKDIELVISGADTELDKSVVERIADPLMHLVRNAVDHGVEPKSVREAAGKTPRGRVYLNAYHESGSIVIEVADDGGGLNRQKILARARERGLIAPAQDLSAGEIDQLIFEPGFSTADAVSNLSGRGVGMDVVRRNIEALQGTVEVESQEGAGTTVRIRMPLTLAIIGGFLVGVGHHSYVVPLEMVQECVELSSADHDAGYVNLRGEVLPLLRLRDQFDIEAGAARRESVVVVASGAQKAGFAVDELLGEFQAVIKPLGRVFQNLKGVSGSTILGSGDVALILDVQGLVQTAIGAMEARTTRKDGVGQMCG